MQVENQNLKLENNLLKQLHDQASSTDQIWVRALMLIGAHLRSDKQMQHAIDLIDGDLDALKELNKFSDL